MLPYDGNYITYENKIFQIYFIYFHSIRSYRIIFWENLTEKNYFVPKRKSLELWQVAKGASFWKLLKKFNVLLLASKLLFSIPVADNMEKF
jgi:hypothetical protein